MNGQKGRFFHLTDTQYAYLLGRNSSFKTGGISTHGYYEFRNTLDIPRLEQALNDVIAAHSMLRTVILPSGMHHELPQVPRYEIRVTDLTEQSEDAIEAAIAKKREKYSHYVFPSDQWPLFKVEFFRLPDGINHMFLSIDLLIADGSSIRIFIRDIINRYLHPDEPVPPETCDFCTFIHEADQLTEKKIYQKSREYWKALIPELPFAPAIPQKPDAKESPRFSRLTHCISHEVFEKLRAQIREQHNIETVILCTAFSKVLSYWCGQSAFTLNITLSDRGKGQMKYLNTIGDYTSLMLMPVQDSGENDFWAAAEQVRQSFMQTYRNSSYDGIKVARDAAKYHGMENEVMFPVVFTSLIGGEIGKKLEPIMGEIVYSISQTPQVYLDFQASEMKGMLCLTWDYLSDRFDSAVMQAMFDQMCSLLEAAAEGGSVSVRDFVKPTEELEHAVRVYNDTAQDIPSDVTLQSLLEQSFRQNAARIALRDDSGIMTYAELDAASAERAAQLRAEGIGRGSCVPVEGKRCKETVVEIAAAIRAGASYVPLNPHDPDDRKAFIKAECGCGTAGEVQPETIAQPDDTAYYIFTSGSTGKPKGVVISNRAVCNTLLDINRRFSVSADDRILNVSAFNFDLSVYDVFGALICGSSLYIAADARDSCALAEILRREQITIWNSVPAIFSLAMQETKDTLPALRTILLSGDWIPLDTLDIVRKKCPNAELISLGGATEASIWSIIYPVQEIRPSWKSIPYGYPLANQKIYVLGTDMRLCPFDVTGMIWIGGAGTADGYLNRSDLTDAAFADHPVYGRLYQTGDLGIFRREGYVDILGRADFQVKINGFRIELEEIRSAVEESPLVARAEITVDETGGRKHLLGYLLPDKHEITETVPLSVITDAADTIEIPDEIAAGKFRSIMDHLNLLALDVIESNLCRFLSAQTFPVSFTLPDLMRLSGVKPRYDKLMREWLILMTEHGRIRCADGVYTLETYKPPVPDEEIRQVIREAVEGTAMSVGYLENCILHLPELLSGDDHVLKYLFKDGSEQNANLFYRRSLLSGYINAVAAETIQAFLMQRKTPCSILELGAGIGGTTESVLKQIGSLNVERYVFTDISRFFTDSAMEKYRAYPFMEYRLYNINDDYRSSFKPESFDVILAANVLHDAISLPQTIKAAESMLRPGGILVLTELTANHPIAAVTIKLTEGFQDYDDFRVKDGKALLTPSQWCKLLKEYGFTEATSLPDDGQNTMFDEHLILAKKEGISRYLDDAELCTIEKHISEKLPEYMIPRNWIQLAELPLNANGKVSTKKLPRPFAPEETERVIRKPETELQASLCEIWSRVLGIAEVSIDESFFHIGGDSVLMLKMLGEVRKQLGITVTYEQFLEQPTVQSLEQILQSIPAADKS